MYTLMYVYVQQLLWFKHKPLEVVVLYQPSRVELNPGQVFINCQPLENVHDDEMKLDTDLEKCIAMSSSMFVLVEDSPCDHQVK